MLKEHRKFRWNELEESALADIKEEIQKREVLAPFETRSDRKVRLTCDGFEKGIRAMLEQEQEEGVYKPVLYWSSAGWRKYVIFLLFCVLYVYTNDLNPTIIINKTYI